MNPVTSALSLLLPTAIRTRQLNHGDHLTSRPSALHQAGVAPNLVPAQLVPLTRLEAVVSDGYRRKSPRSMPPLSSVDLEKMHVDTGKIQAKVGNIAGVMKHQLLGKSQIGWCACENAPTEQRLALIEKIVKNSERAESQDLEFTDVGAGRLLQSYLMMDQLLKRDYGSITLNLIDPFFPESICQSYSALRNFKPKQESFLNNPNFSHDIVTAPKAVAKGFQTAALELLDHLREQTKNLPKVKKDITVRILNTADLLPALRLDASDKTNYKKNKSTYHQIILPILVSQRIANADHFHMLGAGAKDALPHRDRVLVFLEREALPSMQSESGVKQKGKALKKGIFYVKSNIYDDIPIQDKQFLKKVFMFNSLSRKGLQNIFSNHYGEAHLYEDATQSFHQLLDAIPDAEGIKLANKVITEGAAITDQKSQALDEYFKDSGTILGKQISLGYCVVPFEYHE